LDGLPEAIGRGERDVEVGEPRAIGFHADELAHVGMIDAQHAHVGAAAATAGRSDEKSKPVPPPDWWMTAISFTASKTLASVSSTGSTKHAASCPISVPAFISVGELGRNSRRWIAPKNASSQRSASP